MSFGFKSIGHAFASVAHECVVIAKAFAHVEQKIAIQAPLIEAITGVISPNAAEYERAGFACFGVIAEVVAKAGDVAASNGINVQLDAELVASIKALLPSLQAELAKRGIKL